MSNEPRLYVLVRRDLPAAQRVVQAGHAVAELVFRHHSALAESWGEGPAMVVYGVGDELDEWYERLPQPRVAFHEPDMGGFRTACAYYGAGMEEFSRLRLL